MKTRTEPPIPEGLERILSALAEMTDEHRALVFAKLREAYCEHCGCVQPERGWCQCSNDE